MGDTEQDAINALRAAGLEDEALAVEQLRGRHKETMDAFNAGQRASFESGKNYMRERWPVMGYGKVAVGSADLPEGAMCLLYMSMHGETRPIDTDTTDLYPIGSPLDPETVLARVDFANADAVRQTISVLEEMERGMRSNAELCGARRASEPTPGYASVPKTEE